jgi:hypothetical protein
MLQDDPQFRHKHLKTVAFNLETNLKAIISLFQYLCDSDSGSDRPDWNIS